MTETQTLPTASVIVRSKDKAATIEATLQSIRAQTVDTEIVVVDSGSTDGTLEVARRYADELVQIPQSLFSYGRALNVGAARSAGQVHFALSAHVVAKRRDWVERSLQHYSRPRVAATNGALVEPDGSLLLEHFDMTADHIAIDPYWGYSNTAGSWRASVWAEFPFDERMGACEDKEWSWRVLNAGWRIAFDRFLFIDGLHRRRTGVRELFDRVRREGEAMASHAPLEPFTASQALDLWWNATPGASPPLFQRLNYFRAAEIAGRYVGERRGRRQRAARGTVFSDATAIGRYSKAGARGQ
jgi:rhamnosyltransferase